MKYIGPSWSLYLNPDLSQDPLLTKLQELANLPDGWRFGEGVSPQPYTLRRAQEIYQQVAYLRLKADAFPGADGSLSLVFYADERCVEIYISPDGKLDLSVEEGEGREFQEIKNTSDVSIANVVEEVSRLAQKLGRWCIWDLSDSSTHENTINMLNDSAAYALPILAMEQESHWWIPNVYEKAQHHYVGT